MDSNQLNEISSRAGLLAERLRFPLSRRTWRGGAGQFQGQDVGSSLDFQDHRSYLPGDDPRHINWQAFARTGQYSMKLYREEVRPLLDLAVDVSSSMSAFPEKEIRFLELFYFLTHAAVATGASTRLFLLRGTEMRCLAPELVLSHQWREVVQSFALEGKASGLPLGLVPFRSHSMRVLLSDLLFPGEPVPSLQLLAKSRGFGFIFAPFSRSESDPDWSGNYELLDPEAGTRSPRRMDARLLNRYRETYRQHFALWKASALKTGFSLACIDASLPLAESLQVEAVRFQLLELSP